MRVCPLFFPGVKILVLVALAAGVKAALADGPGLKTVTGRISGYSVAAKQGFRAELMFGLVGALVAHGLRGGQSGDVDEDFRTYDIQTEAGTLYVVSREAFEGTPCLEITAPAQAIEKNFVALGTSQLRRIDDCPALKISPPVSAEDIKAKPGRPN